MRGRFHEWISILISKLESPAKARSARLSRTELHRADPIKSGGVHYTPLNLATFIAKQAVAALDGLEVVRILDPACGDGALLDAVAKALSPTSEKWLCGLDLDSEALHSARTRLNTLPNRCHLTLEKLDFLDAILDEQESKASLFAAPGMPILSQQFDLVIANPPYVRTQVLGAEKSQRLATDFGLRGRIDLYQAFAVAMASTLRANGVLALLCSNRFLTTKTGISLREFLAESFDIVTVFDLGDTKVFEAAVLPAIVIARRNERGCDTFPMVTVYEDRLRQDAHKEADSIFEALSSEMEGLVHIDGTSFDIRRGDVEVSTLRSPWIPRGKGDDWVGQIESAAEMRFGDVGKFRVGVKSTADSVFIRESWHSLEDRPEPELILPLITHQVAQRWIGDIPRRSILYPYDLSASRRVPLDLTKWPATAAYLERHRDLLERRKYVVEGGRQWWEIWVPQRPSAWAGAKIVCPDISEEPRFFYDTSGAVVNGDCYWLVTEDERLAYLMIAVANSSLGRSYYDAVCGNKLYAGRRRFITQYVERFPIPKVDQPVVDEIVKVVRHLREGSNNGKRDELENRLDKLVRQSFGIK